MGACRQGEFSVVSRQSSKAVGRSQRSALLGSSQNGFQCVSESVRQCRASRGAGPRAGRTGPRARAREPESGSSEPECRGPSPRARPSVEGRAPSPRAERRRCRRERHCRVRHGAEGPLPPRVAPLEGAFRPGESRPSAEPEPEPEPERRACVRAPSPSSPSPTSESSELRATAAPEALHGRFVDSRSEPRTQNPEPGTQNPELRTQNPARDRTCPSRALDADI